MNAIAYTERINFEAAQFLEEPFASFLPLPFPSMAAQFLRNSINHFKFIKYIFCKQLAEGEVLQGEQLSVFLAAFAEATKSFNSFLLECTLYDYVFQGCAYPFSSETGIEANVESVLQHFYQNLIQCKLDIFQNIPKTRGIKRKATQL